MLIVMGTLGVLVGLGQSDRHILIIGYRHGPSKWY